MFGKLASALSPILLSLDYHVVLSGYERLLLYTMFLLLLNDQVGTHYDTITEFPIVDRMTFLWNIYFSLSGDLLVVRLVGDDEFQGTNCLIVDRNLLFIRPGKRWDAYNNQGKLRVDIV